MNLLTDFIPKGMQVWICYGEGGPKLVTLNRDLQIPGIGAYYQSQVIPLKELIGSGSKAKFQYLTRKELYATYEEAAKAWNDKVKEDIKRQEQDLEYIKKRLETTRNSFVDPKVPQVKSTKKKGQISI